MTTPEPTAANGLAPVMSTFVDRLYGRLPRIYRVLDAQNDYQFKRYLGGALRFGGEIDDVIETFRGARPVGPRHPEPWDMDADDLERWREARETRLSLLTDPESAPPEYLPWMAQLVGAFLPAAASLAERRDIVGGAGYRAGTRSAIAEAARSALTGSRYVDVLPHQAGGIAGTIWDITIRTRSTETPDPAAVLATVIRKGAKPAGAKLHHATFGTSWDKIEALFPTWEDWEAHTWDEIEEAGVTYADVPENILAAFNPSFETSVAPWVPRVFGGGTIPTLTYRADSGIDGASSGRLTMVGTTGGMQLSTPIIADARILPGREYVVGISGRPSVAMTARFDVEWLTGAGAAISTTTVAAGSLAPGEWNRGVLTTRHLAPATAARARMNVVITPPPAAGAYVDFDAALFRLISTTGG